MSTKSKENSLGFESQNRFHSSGCRTLYEEASEIARALATKKVSPKGPAVRNANAHLFH